MRIQAGPDGSTSVRLRSGLDDAASWQTARERHRGQDASFSVAFAPQSVPGAAARGPYREVLHSKTSVFWQPTLEPFVRELPASCNWILLGTPGDIAGEFKHLEQRWKRIDRANAALSRLAPEQLVRSRLVDHVSHDLAVGASGGWDVSVDRLHGRVIAARFAGDATIQTGGVALPILVPRVGDLAWSDIADIRKDKAIRRLREVLREVEVEAMDTARSGGDLESAVHRAYTRKVAPASEGVHGLRSVGAMAVAELVIGTAAGYVTMGLSLFGPLAGAGLGAAISTGWQARRVVRERRQRAWLGVMDAISTAAP